MHPTTANIKIQQALLVPEGAGVTVKRLMPVHGLLNFDPFVLWDHFDIETGGFPDHPHRGFEAITYLFSGGMKHADNLGNRGIVHARGAQRFTAGRGLIHSEFPDGHANGIQLWINLPARLKSLPPEYQQIQGGEFPEHEQNGVLIRTIVGGSSPLTIRTPMEYLDLLFVPDTTMEREIPAGFRGFIYVVEGELSSCDKNVAAGQALIIDDEETLTLTATQTAQAMWCFGKPHREPIHQHGPYVD